MVLGHVHRAGHRSTRTRYDLAGRQAGCASLGAFKAYGHGGLEETGC